MSSRVDDRHGAVRPLRVGVVTTSYPREPGDPAGSFVAAHVDAMRALGHDVDVIAARDIVGDARGANAFGKRLFDGSGAPEALERGGLVERARALLDGALFTAKLTAAIYKRIADWDLVVAHWLPCAIAALPATRPLHSRARKPLLAIAHGGDVHTLRRTHLLAPIMKTLAMRGAKMAFVSTELRDLALDERARATAFVQPMGIDVARFAGIARAPTTPPTIAIIGRLVPIKGIDVAIDAMTHVGTSAQLVIAGDGPERGALEARNQAVVFRGQIGPAERDALLARASVVVIPSRILPNGRSEGMPLVALEALAAGVPVIASDVGGLRELKRIVRVPPDDPRALAAAIERVLARPSTRGATDELRASVEHLAWPRVAQRLLDFAHA